MTLNLRRIVTGHDAEGKAVVVTDGMTTNVQQLRSGNFETLLWVTEDTPADVNGEDTSSDPRDIEPPARGSIFRVLELVPGKQAYMHRTDTIDDGICISGKCVLVLDDGDEVVVNAGDVVVQRGNWHGWANPYDEPCRLAAVLIGANAPARHWHE